MKLEFKNVSIEDASASTLIVFAHEDKSNKSTKKGQKEASKSETKISLKNLPVELVKSLDPAIEDKSLKTKLNDTNFFREFCYANYRHVIVVGMGEKVHAEEARQAGSTVHACIKSANVKDVVVGFDSLSGGKKESAELAGAFVEGLLLTDYTFDELKSKKSEAKKEELSITVATKSANEKALKHAVEKHTVLAECVNFARRLGDMPGNHMTPEILADSAIAAAKGTALKVTAWDKAKIKKEKMGGLLGVNQGSGQEPRFIVMEYKGAAKGKKPVVYVGKGLTFDCGGISIKPSSGMEEMKYDMCGGAAVIATMLAIAKLKLKVNAIGLVPATENLVGPFATKPGDVHTARNGKTFEINNTDAEGRLILADALCYASEQDPAVIVDCATLTGAMQVALGNIHTGYFTRNYDLKKKIESAAEQSGEWVWNMPLCDFHVKDMKGTYADLSNMSSGKGAGSATAAAFLEQFVGENIPWAHFDVAGTAWHIGGRWNYHPKKGASGIMVRTFVELAEKF